MGGGVTSAIVPAASRRTTTLRPPSAGRCSIQYSVAPSRMSWVSPTPADATSAAVMGERHEPYGARVAIGALRLSRVQASAGWYTPSRSAGSAYQSGSFLGSEQLHEA